MFRNILLPLYPQNMCFAMKLRFFIISICVACISTVALAQDHNNTMPDLFTADQGFFDPTRKTSEKEEDQFSTQWRLQLGYTQLDHRTKDTTAVYQHGVKLGTTVDFILPRNFSIQTGALLTFTYGQNNQHWANVDDEDAQINILKHNLLQLQLTIPVRAYYNVNVWKQLNLFFFAGPQLNIGLTNYDILKANVSPSVLDWLQSQGIATDPYERYIKKDLYRTNIQFGLGAGLEWQRYRIQGGYDFGLNNILRSTSLSKLKMYEWGWYATFSYKL